MLSINIALNNKERPAPWYMYMYVGSLTGCSWGGHYAIPKSICNEFASCALTWLINLGPRQAITSLPFHNHHLNMDLTHD